MVDSHPSVNILWVVQNRLIRKWRNNSTASKLQLGTEEYMPNLREVERLTHRMGFKKTTETQGKKFRGGRSRYVTRNAEPGLRWWSISLTVH